jgi:plastocyanin
MTRMAVTMRGFAFGVVAIGTVLLSAGLVGRALSVRTVDMHDACDDVSFNAAFGDGICIDGLGGGVTVDTFLQVLERSQKMGAWHFAPGTVRLKEGQAVQAYNSGGEVHTFTEVAEFGGGFIPELNQLTGDLVPAPECLNIPALEFIPAGETGTAEVKPKGMHLYECCIHPWMRATVTVR